MSSRDGTGPFGPGAISAAEKAKGGNGGLPAPPPKPGAARTVAVAAESAAAGFAAAGPPQAPVSAVVLSDEGAQARVARAGLRQFKRESSNANTPLAVAPVHTPTGNATAHKVWEFNTQK